MATLFQTKNCGEKNKQKSPMATKRGGDGVSQINPINPIIRGWGNFE